MNQGKIIVGIAVALGIAAGLAGYWWNYRVGHRALEYWGPETSQLVRLAPKVRVFELIPQSDPAAPNDALGIIPSYHGTMLVTKITDISQARGLIHLRNAILSDDQFDWTPTKARFVPQFAIEFRDEDGTKATLLFDVKQKFASQNDVNKVVILGPLAKSLEQFLERELPRAEKDTAVVPVPAKSE